MRHSHTSASRHHRTSVLVVSALSVLALVASACSSNDTATVESTTTTEPAPALDNSLCGTGQPATGEAIKVGLLNQNDDSAGSFSELTAATNAAVACVNETGGISGSPIELVACSPVAGQGGSECADDFIDAEVAVVLGGVAFDSAGVYEPLAEEGIFVLGQLPLAPGDESAPNAAVLASGGYGQLAAIAAYITDLTPAPSVRILQGPDPGNASVGALATAEFTIRQVTDVESVTVELGEIAQRDEPDEDTDESSTTTTVVGTTTASPTTDVPLSLSDAFDGLAVEDPDAIVVVLPESQCGLVLDAAAEAEVRAESLYFLAGCFDQRVLADRKEAAAEAVFALDYLPSGFADPEVAFFEAQLQARAPDAPTSIFAQQGFSNVLTLVALLREIDGAPTPEAIETRLREGGPLQVFMGDEANCDQAQPFNVDLPYVAFCRASVRLVRFATDATLVDIQEGWVTALGDV